MRGPAYLSGARSAKVFACFAAAYLLSYAFRAINAVIAPALIADAQLSNADLGLLSSAYFFAFAGMQLPLGVWLDKYGARRTECALLLFAAAGAALFALSSSLAGLWLGRAMIGVGVSGCLMAPYKAYRQWYAPQRQPQLASWMLMAGTSGVLLTTVPVAWLMPLIGWRAIFGIMSALILLVAAAIFILVREVEYDMPLPPAGAQDEPGGYRMIFNDPYFRRIGLLGLISQGIFLAFQTLWAGPWMITVLGMDKAQAAEILLFFNFALLLSYLGVSWWAPRYIAQDDGPGWPVLRVVSLGLTGALAMQVLIIFCSGSWAWLLWGALALFVTVNALVQTHIAMSFPAALAGRANSAFNLLLFVGAFIAQWGIGVLIDWFAQRGLGPAAAMQAAFAVCVALQALGLALFVLNPARARLAAA